MQEWEYEKKLLTRICEEAESGQVYCHNENWINDDGMLKFEGESFSIVVFEYGDEDCNALGYSLELKAYPNIFWHIEGELPERLYNAVLPKAKRPGKFLSRQWKNHTDVLKKVLSIIG